MPWHLAVLLAWPLHLVWGRPWVQPQETRTATVTAGWSPAPTTMKGLSIDADLFKRGIYPVSVCGWIGAKVASPAYCSTSSSCVWNSDYHIIGCCTTSGSNCAFYTSCIDLKSPAQVDDRSNVFTCRGTSVCYLNTYPNNYHQWGCGAAAWATTVATTYPGIGELSLQIVFTGTKAAGSITDTPLTSNPTTSTPPTISTSSSATASGSSSEISPQISQSSPSTASSASLLISQSSTAAGVAQSSLEASSSDSSSSSNSRAVAIGGGIGGAVGGVLFLGLGVAILWWRWKRYWDECLKIAQMDDTSHHGHKPIVEERIREPIHEPVRESILEPPREPVHEPVQELAVEERPQELAVEEPVHELSVENERPVELPVEQKHKSAFIITPE